MVSETECVMVFGNKDNEGHTENNHRFLCHSYSPAMKAIFLRRRCLSATAYIRNSSKQLQCAGSSGVRTSSELHIETKIPASSFGAQHSSSTEPAPLEHEWQ